MGDVTEPVPRGRPETINAVTLGSTDLETAHEFYAALGFEVAHGDPAAGFISYAVGPTFLNLQQVESTTTGWGRFIVHVDDVDAMYERAVAAGFTPSMEPSDAPWGERYFHIDDPDGHEVSFARVL